MRKSLLYFALASAVYAALGVWLFWGHFWRFDKFDVFMIPFAVIGACGYYTISSKWVSSWGMKVSAGGFYAFGCLGLWFLKLNIVGGFLVAVLPWLFLPAIFLSVRIKSKTKIELLLWAMPFAFVLILFLLLAMPAIGPYYPVPNENLSLGKLKYLVSPLFDVEDIFKLSFYHIGFIGLLAGLFYCTHPRQTSPLLIFIVGLIGSMGIKLLNTSPAVWLLFANLGGALMGSISLEKMCKKASIRNILFVLVLIDIVITGKILAAGLF